MDANYAEHVPCRLFHSVAAGLPLVYAPQPGVQAVAGPLGLGVPVDPADAGSIADGILRISDPGTARELRQNVARARVELSWERQEHLLANLLCDLGVSGGGGSLPGPEEGRTD